MRKIVLYVRASREDLEHCPEGTLTSQQQRLEEYVKSRNVVSPGWGKIVGTYMDEARSAKDTNRPQFKGMLTAIELRKADTILVTELSRLSRSVKDFCAIWDFLKAHRAQFLSLREQFDTTTAAGEMMVFSIMNFAQFERMQTSERVSANFLARAMRGLYNGGYPTLGLDPHPEKKGHLVINEEEAHDVRRIFQIFHETGSLRGALDRVNAAGIKTKKRLCSDGKVKGGRDFTLNTLFLTLRNRHYIGEREIHKRYRFWNKESAPEGKAYKTAKASWGAIVAPDLFAAVQETLDNNQKRFKPESRRTFDYLYSSVVFCFECGKPMVGISGKSKTGEKHFYYGHKGRKGPCKIHAVDALEFHKTMRNRFRRLAHEPAFVAALYQSAEANKVELLPDNERRISMLAKQISELDQQIRILMDTLQSSHATVVKDLITKELEIKGTTLKAKTDERNALSAQLAGTRGVPADQDTFMELAKGWDRKFAQLTQAERKQFIRTFIGRVEIFENRLRIRYNYDQRMVARSLNVIDLASYRNRLQAGAPAPAPHPLFAKKGQGAWGSDTVCIGRAGGIRTHDPLHPMQVRYQAALHPELS